MRLVPVVLSILALFAAAAACAQQARTNRFGDPFGPATAGLAGCPVPAGPRYTAEEAAREGHYRAERGTSCFRSGRCRLPNAYRYDSEIFPRAVQFLQQDDRFTGTSLWLSVQRRWITVSGCVGTPSQGIAIEQALRGIDDVEAVIANWMVGTSGKPPYETVDSAPSDSPRR